MFKRSKKRTFVSLRDYHSKSYRNPFFIRKKKNNLFKKLKWILILIIVILVIYFFFASAFWEIKNIKIEIKDASNIKKQDIETLVRQQFFQHRFFIFKQNNIFLFSKKLGEKAINSKYVVEDLKIKKRWPHTLKIQFKEKPSTLILSLNNKYYYLDLTGLILTEVPVFEINKNFPLVIFEGSREMRVGERFLNPDLIKFITDLKTIFTTKTKIPLASFKIKEKEETNLIVLTQEGWEVYLDSQDNLENQINNFLLVLRGKIKEQRKNLKYIDLRFGNRVFYK